MDARTRELLERIRRFALPEGPVACRAIRIRQQGELWLAPGRKPLPFAAEQWFDAAGLAFRWTARAWMGRVLPATVVDRFEDGRGELSVRLLGALPVGRSRGPAVDKGEVMRAIAEMPWRPMGFAERADLAWSTLSDSRLRAAYDDGRTRAAVEFEVEEEGRVLRALAPDRPRAVGSESVETGWSGSFLDYHDVGEMRVPAYAWVHWHLPEGPFEYFRCHVTGLELIP